MAWQQIVLLCWFGFGAAFTSLLVSETKAAVLFVAGFFVIQVLLVVTI